MLYIRFNDSTSFDQKDRSKWTVLIPPSSLYIGPGGAVDEVFQNDSPTYCHKDFVSNSWFYTIHLRAHNTDCNSENGRPHDTREFRRVLHSTLHHTSGIVLTVYFCMRLKDPRKNSQEFNIRNTF